MAPDMSSKNAWRVEKWHVRTALRCSGVNLPEEAIMLPDEPIDGPENVSGCHLCQRIMYLFSWSVQK